MPWFKVDDGFWGHPKRLACPLSAIGLWVAAGSWAAQQMTDGHVPRHVLPVLGGKAKDAAALVTAGLWTTTARGWRFHDWDDMQPTRAQTEAKRAEDAERKRQARAEKAARAAARAGNVQPESDERPDGRETGSGPDSNETELDHDENAPPVIDSSSEIPSGPESSLSGGQRADLHRRAAVRPTSGRTPSGIRPESALPDPTRPDPTRSTSVVASKEEVEVELPAGPDHFDQPDPVDAAEAGRTLRAVLAGWPEADPDELRRLA